MIKIPADNKWTQNNDSDLLGSISKSLNIDLFTNKSALRVSPRMKITTDDITNLGVSSGFVIFNAFDVGNGIYTVSGDRIFNSNSFDGEVAFVETASSPTTGSDNSSDIIYFQKANRLVVSLEHSVVSLNTSGSFATVAGNPLTGGNPHMMCEYANRLYCSNYFKQVVSFDTSMNITLTGNPNTFLIGTLDENLLGLFISDITTVSDGIWIFTIGAHSGQNSIAYKWDGVTQDDPDATYLLDSGGILSSIVRNDVPYVMNAEGELMYFNGGTFVRMPNGRLPIKRDKYLKNSFSSVNNRWIHPNGMVVNEDGNINILINNVYEDGTYEDNLPSGIWEFNLADINVGWVHKHSLSSYSTTLTDHGQQRVSKVGGLDSMKIPGKKGLFLSGAQIYSDATATKEVIEITDSADTLQKYGYFITPRIFSNQITDHWIKAYVRNEKLLNADDHIIIKYRTSKIDTTEAIITWTSTTTFTTTTDLSAFSTGDEVEIVQGKGGGKTSQITSITVSAGTYTVTTDETFAGVTGTAKAVFGYWKKAGRLSDLDAKYLQSVLGNNLTDTWIQLKICMQFTGEGEINDVIIDNKTHKPI